MKSDKKVKVMEEVIKFEDEVITIYDISLHKKGPMEDKIYINSEFYLTNIRRGNSLSLKGNDL